MAIGATTAGIYAYWKQQEESLLRNKAEAVLDDIATNLIPVWADDEQSPDYKHLSEWSRLPNTGNGFTISPAVIAMLIVSNEFAPTALDGKIVVALRGCSFAPPQFLHERPSLELFGTRPDHAHPDAVVIVYDMVNSVLSGFDGSSVPSSEALQQTVIPEIHTAIGLPVEHSARCNLLPTGLFHYRVGSHNGRPGVLVQYQQIAVRRTYTNLTYEVKDPWDVTYVFDDLYPSSAAFYSYGSLTISEGDGQNHAPWASFRAALGLTGEGQEEDGKRVDVLLVTGLDAEIAAEFLNARFGSPQERSEDRDRYLVRLRQGSRGEHVKKLQAALRLPQTGEFDGMTAKGLADLQTTKLGWSDGIYSPEMDQQLGLCVYERPDCR